MANLPFDVMPSIVASDVQSRSPRLAKKNDENGFVLPHMNAGKSPEESSTCRKVLAERNRVPTSGHREAYVKKKKNPLKERGHRENVPPTSWDDDCGDQLDRRRSYDPVNNCCSVRPRFLRYGPNRRKEILLRSKMELQGEEGEGSAIELDLGAFVCEEVPEDVEDDCNAFGSNVMSLRLSNEVVEGELGSSSNPSNEDCPIGASEMDPTDQIKVEDDAADQDISGLEGTVNIELAVSFEDSKNCCRSEAASEKMDEINKTGCETVEENPQSLDELGAKNVDPSGILEFGGEIGEDDFEGRLVDCGIVDDGTRFDSNGHGSVELLKNDRNTTIEPVELEQIQPERVAEFDNFSSYVDEISNEISLSYRLVSTLAWCYDIAKYVEAYLNDGEGYKSWVSLKLGMAALIASGTFMFGILGFLHPKNKRNIAQKSLKPSPSTPLISDHVERSCSEKRSPPSSHAKQIPEKHHGGILTCPPKVELHWEFSVVYGERDGKDQRKNLSMKGTSEMESVASSSEHLIGEKGEMSGSRARVEYEHHNSA